MNRIAIRHAAGAVGIAHLLGLCSAPAMAQQALQFSGIVQPVLPADYNRGRNVSVTERKREDYDPLGIQVRSFYLFPRIDATLGGSDNVYATQGDDQTDGYVTVAPSMRLISDWGRHALSIGGGGSFRRYFSSPEASANQWNASALGRLDIGSSFTVTAEARGARVQEDPFSGEVLTSVAALSRYTQGYFAGRVQYQAGRVRATFSYDHSLYDFSDVRFANGVVLSQADRDRNIDQLTTQIEYALSPSLSLYGQASVADTNYSRDTLLNGTPNRDSHSWRGLVGFSADISGFLRGTVGIGYSERTYASAFYNDVKGVSAEVKVEYFPSELTTFTLLGRRTIDDASLANIGAFYNNQVSLRVDHELRRNILLNASAGFTNQDYIGTPEYSNLYRAGIGGEFLMNRWLRFRLEASAGKRDRRNSIADGSVRDDRAAFTVIFQR